MSELRFGTHHASECRYRDCPFRGQSGMHYLMPPIRVTYGGPLATVYAKPVEPPTLAMPRRLVLGHEVSVGHGPLHVVHLALACGHFKRVRLWGKEDVPAVARCAQCRDAHGGRRRWRKDVQAHGVEE